MLQNFKYTLIEDFVNNVFDSKNRFYIFFNKPTAWNNEAAPDTFVETTNNLSYKIFDDMIFGKVLRQSDFAVSAKRYDWQTNTVYAMYDDTENLNDKNFYVVCYNASNYEVFKCLDNNGGSKSTIKPNLIMTSPTEPFFKTSDGYVWKYLFSVPQNIFEKFGTAETFPIIENSTVVTSAVSGTIDVLKLKDQGSPFNSYTTGYFQEVAVSGNNYILTIESSSSPETDFFKGCAIKITQGLGSGQQREIADYTTSGGFKRVILNQPFDVTPDTSSRYLISPNVKIQGDGTGASAIALIDPQSNTISSIEVTTRGSGYTYADIEVYGNTGLLQNPTPPVVSAVIAPYGGHGSNAIKELFANKIVASVQVNNNESGTIPDYGTFRQVGLIRNPKFDDVEIELVNHLGVFTVGEKVNYQGSYVGIVNSYNTSTHKLKLRKVNPILSGGELLIGATSNAQGNVSVIKISNQLKSFDTFDQRLKLETSMNSVPPFVTGKTITQDTTLATGIVYSSNTTMTTMTNTKGVFNTFDIDQSFTLRTDDFRSANVSTIIPKDLVKGEGSVININNIEFHTRTPASNEIIKFTIGFD